MSRYFVNVCINRLYLCLQIPSKGRCISFLAGCLNRCPESLSGFPDSLFYCKEILLGYLHILYGYLKCSFWCWNRSDCLYWYLDILSGCKDCLSLVSLLDSKRASDRERYNCCVLERASWTKKGMSFQWMLNEWNARMRFISLFIHFPSPDSN